MIKSGQFYALDKTHKATNNIKCTKNHLGAPKYNSKSIIDEVNNLVERANMT